MDWKKTSSNHLCIWGCPAEVKIYNLSIEKIDLRSTSCYFVDYPDRSEG